MSENCEISVKYRAKKAKLEIKSEKNVSMKYNAKRAKLKTKRDNSQKIAAK
jgi:hypothetical protein